MIESVKSEDVKQFQEWCSSKDYSSKGISLLQSFNIYEGMFCLIEMSGINLIHFVKWNNPRTANCGLVTSLYESNTLEYLDLCPYLLFSKINYTNEAYPDAFKKKYIELLNYHKKYTCPVTKGRVYTTSGLGHIEYKIMSEVQGRYWKAFRPDWKWAIVPKEAVRQDIPFRDKFQQ